MTDSPAGPGLDLSSLTPRQPLAEEVARRLSTEIAAGHVTPGDRLPTEVELSRSFGVSRSVVREAIARLKYEGLVETHQGRGAFITRFPAKTSFRLAEGRLQEQELREIFELRAIVEAGTAALAASRRSGTQLRAIAAALTQMRAAIASGDDGVAPDVAFHQAIAAAADNAACRDFMQFLAARLESSISAARGNSRRFEGWADHVQHEHEAIHSAIADGNPDAASEAAKAHVTNAARRLGLAVPETRT